MVKDSTAVPADFCLRNFTSKNQTVPMRSRATTSISAALAVQFLSIMRKPAFARCSTASVSQKPPTSVRRFSFGGIFSVGAIGRFEVFIFESYSLRSLLPKKNPGKTGISPNGKQALSSVVIGAGYPSSPSVPLSARSLVSPPSLGL